jgi:hypothetical protein
MPGKYLRGAFIQFRSAFLTPVPKVIVFQYNPETISHSWSPYESDAASPSPKGNPLKVGGDPQEEFSFTLMLDAADTVADGTPPASALTAASGVLPRLAALELLLFPAPQTGAQALLSAAAAAAAGAVAGAASAAGAPGKTAGVPRSVPLATVPAILFAWGPGRILPVRVTKLQITEKLYDNITLVPTHAQVEVGLRTLTREDLTGLDEGLVKGIIKVAYTAARVQRDALALANLVNSADSIIGMWPS